MKHRSKNIFWNFLPELKALVRTQIDIYTSLRVWCLAHNNNFYHILPIVFASINWLDEQEVHMRLLYILRINLLELATLLNQLERHWEGKQNSLTKYRVKKLSWGFKEWWYLILLETIKEFIGNINKFSEFICYFVLLTHNCIHAATQCKYTLKILS